MGCGWWVVVGGLWLLVGPLWWVRRDARDEPTMLSALGCDLAWQGHPAAAFTELALERLAARQYPEALRDIDVALDGAEDPPADAKSALAEALLVRWMVLSKASVEASDADVGALVATGDTAMSAVADSASADRAIATPPATPSVTAASAEAAPGGGGTPPHAATARTTLLSKAKESLELATRLQPASPRYQLAWGAMRLRESSLHAAEAVPALARAIESELSADADPSPPDRTSTRTVALLADSSGRVAAAAAPSTTLGDDDDAHGLHAALSTAYLWYLWNVAPALQPAMRAHPSIERLLRTLLTPRSAIGATPCDLEQTVSSGRGTRHEASGDRSRGRAAGGPAEETLPEPADQRQRAATAPRTVAAWRVDPAEAEQAMGLPRGAGTTRRAELRVNELGVPSLKLWHDETRVL